MLNIADEYTREEHVSDFTLLRRVPRVLSKRDLVFLHDQAYSQLAPVLYRDDQYPVHA